MFQTFTHEAFSCASKVNKSFNTRIEWHYKLSLETYLNTHFPFFTIYNRGILMIPCLIFLCQVGLHFCECWVIFSTAVISSFALFFRVCLELKSSFPIVSQFAWSLFTFKRQKCKFIRGRQNNFHQIELRNDFNH